MDTDALTLLIQLFYWFLVIGAGMASGSYATSVYWRLPHKEAVAGIWHGVRAHCVMCNTKLRTRDLVPVLNWLWTRGRCFNCGTRVNPTYFFVEFGCVCVSIAAYLQYGWDQHYLLAGAAGVTLVIAATMAFSYRRVAMPLCWTLLALGAISRALHDGQIYDLIISITFSTLISLAIWKRYAETNYDTPLLRGTLLLLATSGAWFSIVPLLFLIIASLFLVLFFACLHRLSPSFRRFLVPALALLYFITILRPDWGIQLIL